MVGILSSCFRGGPSAKNRRPKSLFCGKGLLVEILKMSSEEVIFGDYFLKIGNILSPKPRHLLLSSPPLPSPPLPHPPLSTPSLFFLPKISHTCSIHFYFQINQESFHWLWQEQTDWLVTWAWHCGLRELAFTPKVRLKLTTSWFLAFTIGSLSH